jgi:hypothetical protein
LRVRQFSFTVDQNSLREKDLSNSPALIVGLELPHSRNIDYGQLAELNEGIPVRSSGADAPELSFQVYDLPRKFGIPLLVVRLGNFSPQFRTQ